ncbi:MAG: ferredoxin family protein [Planctomycetota bacterium]|nr:ferredoxin family protein [Planctomycetota bacterium]
MAGKLQVVICQHQGKNPVKRHLEESIAAALIMDDGLDVSLVPHLYDMSHDHTGMLFLRSVPGDVVILSWLYPRSARWILDRAGVRGHEGVTMLTSDDDDEDEDEEEAEEAPELKGIGAVNVPNRKIYCIDMRVRSDLDSFITELKRISADKSVKTFDLMNWIQGNPKQEQLERYLHPERMLQAAGNGNGNGNGSVNGNGNGHAHADVLPEPTKRRWYPVIDYSRCTNCMECIDFCLFGVYGVDTVDRILVEEQDNCKKGCPACSRVCPENAIIFPGHKSPAIAGADGEVGSMKIDLSRLFGGESSQSALEMAVQERDTELVADGRHAVGMSIGIPKRREHQDEKRDELDDLIDGLDDLDI